MVSDRADIEHLRSGLERTLPRPCTVLVVSRGDHRLLALDGRRAWHFPQTPDGTYTGEKPTDSAAAIALLERLRSRGAEYLVFPSHSYWWLDYYTELYHYLARQFECIVSVRGCLVYRIASVTIGSSFHETLVADEAVVRQLRPRISTTALGRARQTTQRLSVFVVGTYRAEDVQTTAHVISGLGNGRAAVTQRWAALDCEPATLLVAGSTSLIAMGTLPRSRAISALLSLEDLAQYDYVLIAHGGVILPNRFTDVFFSLQYQLAFDVAVPAPCQTCTFHSPVHQQTGALAREVAHAPEGPLVSIRAECLSTPSRLGHGSVRGPRSWTAVDSEGLRSGIIDASPVLEDSFLYLRRSQSATDASDVPVVPGDSFHVLTVYPAETAARDL